MTNSVEKDAHRTEFLKFGSEPSYTSPGGASEIRMLLQRPEGELSHARSPAHRSSRPATVEHTVEMFFILAGWGFLWRSLGDSEDLVELRSGRATLIPEGARFQYRSETDLVFMVATLPLWKAENWHEVKGGPWQPGASSGVTPTESARHLWPVMDLKRTPDYFAPDGSEIRLLTEHGRGGLAHCALAAGRISTPMRHRTVSEIWFILAGHGTLWRRDGEGRESSTQLHYGVEVEINPLTAFQFRSTGNLDLEVLILTMPAWPEPAEAEPVEGGCWQDDGALGHKHYAFEHGI
jgi:mannose-6-phosphate isomerase-like protein (cupin superfamily)